MMRFVNLSLLLLMIALVGCSSTPKDGSERFFAKVPYERKQIIPLINDVLVELDTLRTSSHRHALVCLKIGRITSMAKRMEKRKEWPELKELRHSHLSQFCGGKTTAGSSFGVRKLRAKNKLMLLKSRINRYQRYTI